MIYQPKPEGTFANFDSNNTPNYIHYVNPLDYNQKIYDGSLLLVDNTYLNLKLDHLSEDKHAPRILVKFQKQLQNVITGEKIEYNLEYEQFCELVVGYMAQLGPTKRLQICIDEQSFPYQIDYQKLINLLDKRIVNAGLQVVYGYSWVINQTGNSINIYRQSLNGFNPENNYPVENGTTFYIDSVRDFESNLENLYNSISSLKVGQVIYIELSKDFDSEERKSYIHKLRGQIFYTGYNLANGFNYEFKWFNPKYQVLRLTLDGKREPAIEA